MLKLKPPKEDLKRLYMFNVRYWPTCVEFNGMSYGSSSPFSTSPPSSYCSCSKWTHMGTPVFNDGTHGRVSRCQPRCDARWFLDLRIHMDRALVVLGFGTLVSSGALFWALVFLCVC